MREGIFEISLFRAKLSESANPENVLFDEKTVNGISYALADPGEEYCVKLNVYRRPDGNFAPSRLRVGLYVDGNDVQYWKRIDLSQEHLLPTDMNTPVTATFWGFKKNVNDIRSFVFASPSVVSEPSQLTADIDAPHIGEIKVIIYEACVIGGTFENNTGVHELPSSHSISEGKKFWQQASLGTSAGRKLSSEQESFNPLERWSNLSDTPLHSMTLRYHTKSTIDCISQIGVKHSFEIGNSAVSNTSKRVKYEEIVDLISDDDSDEPLFLPSDEEQEQRVGDEDTYIEEVKVPKAVPLLDLCGPGDAGAEGEGQEQGWTTVLVHR